MNLARRSRRATWRITSGRRYLSAVAIVGSAAGGGADASPFRGRCRIHLTPAAESPPAGPAKLPPDRHPSCRSVNQARPLEVGSTEGIVMAARKTQSTTGNGKNGPTTRGRKAGGGSTRRKSEEKRAIQEASAELTRAPAESAEDVGRLRRECEELRREIAEADRRLGELREQGRQ